MSKELDISRRKLLAGLGGIGAAGALGGSGTAALLWDEEVFGSAETPNVLQAGELDLKVDWEEHYVDWIGAETEYDVVMVEGGDIPDGYEPLPTPENPLIAVHQDDIEAFMDATVTETSDEFDGPDDIDAEEEDAPHDLVDQPDPVVTIEDVKPGDFGEVTFSYHLFGNPGFVTACADVVADEDNGIVEPEDKVNGHDPDNSDGTDGGDLGDHAMAQAWYDPDCNNRFDGGEAEVMLVTDASESMSDFLPGAPDVNPADGLENEFGASALEGVKAAVGVGEGGGAEFDGLIDDVVEDCGGSVQFGSVSASRDLHHLDNLDDGDDSDSTLGRDDGALDAILDKGLHPPGELQEMSSLYGPGAEIPSHFITEDSTVNGVDNDGVNGPDEYEAERTYTEDGGSTVPIGVERAHRALIPSGQDTSIPDGNGGFLSGIDPHGNASDPNEARKMIVVFTDDAFSAEGFDPIPYAQKISSNATEDGIEIVPVVTEPFPSAQDVAFAQELSTSGLLYFATHYDTGDSDFSDCPSAVTDVGEECVALTTAMKELESNICARAGGEQLIASGTLNDVMGDLGAFEEECQVLSPVASGSGVATDFTGTECHQPSQTGCIALAWWLPRDIPGVNDNIINTDRYEFKLSFNAVQCRHNVTDDGEPIDLNLGDADAEATGD